MLRQQWPRLERWHRWCSSLAMAAPRAVRGPRARCGTWQLTRGRPRRPASRRRPGRRSCASWRAARPAAARRLPRRCQPLQPARRSGRPASSTAAHFRRWCACSRGSPGPKAPAARPLWGIRVQARWRCPPREQHRWRPRWPRQSGSSSRARTSVQRSRLLRVPSRHWRGCCRWAAWRDRPSQQPFPRPCAALPRAPTSGPMPSWPRACLYSWCSCWNRAPQSAAPVPQPPSGL
mmetsp:Transcript_14647/g.40425  ORF Transcript_14647/g.40425 Transcript_14647/m.40425 type:complete len:234 (+) Transcript_14647:895-1596(+)